MIEFEEAIKALKGTSIEKAIRNMHEFYHNVENSIIPFSMKEGVQCPSGCGKCCEKFLPDLTKLESLYLAAYISFSEKKEEIREKLEKALGQKNGPCPLPSAVWLNTTSRITSIPFSCRLFTMALNSAPGSSELL